MLVQQGLARDGWPVPDGLKRPSDAGVAGISPVFD